MSSNPAVPSLDRRRPGGRSARVRQAVLEATVTELLREGYDGLSIPAVAASAGVHETSIYRRWGTKSSLVMDACQSMAGDAIPTPDTGTLRSDLRHLLRDVVGLLASPRGKAIGAMIIAAQGSAEAGQLARTFWRRRFELAAAVFERARERGELTTRLPVPLLLELLVGPLYFRALVSGEPLDRSYADQVIDTLLRIAGPSRRR